MMAGFRGWGIPIGAGGDTTPPVGGCVFPGALTYPSIGLFPGCGSLLYPGTATFPALTTYPRA